MSKKNLSDWVALHDDRRVLLYDLDDGWLVVHLYGITDAGVLDLRGFHVEPCALVKRKDVEDRVQQLGQSWDVPPGPPLTSRRLRVMSSQGSSLREARRRLPMIASFVWVDPPPTRTSTIHDLARLVVRYAELIDAGGGARQKLAAENGMTVDGIKTRLNRARKQGLWITSTPGKPGTPSPRAYQLLEDWRMLEGSDK